MFSRFGVLFSFKEEMTRDVIFVNLNKLTAGGKINFSYR